MAIITHLTPSPRDPRRVALRVNNKAVATLPASAVEALGLAVGGAWDDGLAQRVRAEAAFDDALRRAARRIDRRAQSTAEAAATLAREGVEPALAARVLERLTSLGLLDDAALGQALIDETLAKAPAGPALLRAKLARRGLDEPLIEQLLGDGAPAADFELARDLAQKRLARMAGLAPQARARRVAGMLARRGFDEQTISAALEGLPGLPDPHTDGDAAFDAGADADAGMGSDGDPLPPDDAST